MSRIVDFYQTAEVYHNGIRFIFGNDTEKIIKKINNYLRTDFSINHLEAKGCLFKRKGFSPIIWMPKFPSSPDNYGTLSHEILHGVKYILYNWAGMSFGDDSEEAYCHLQSYFTEKVLEKINSIKKKARNKK